MECPGDCDEVAVAVGAGPAPALDAGGFRAYADHLCVSFGASHGSLAWPQGPPGPEAGVPQLLCRACRQPVLPLLPGRQGLLLPSGSWQACLESLACEECRPLQEGPGEPAMDPGRVYVSPQCLLARGADLAGTASEGPDGLVRCGCGAVVGEVAPRGPHLMA
ncbi:unnamed protein product [Prorocentrum cordatum]|uniref:E3 ubiquitin-protein ligase n=1 Tax=Prorocentrum cordatum TaxID=2364126 RepID=A0ABN9V119_9DINO|nr:unnamed protein product [Polarella glacialis]